MHIITKTIAILMSLFFATLTAIPLTAAPIETFDGPINIGATQSPGVWYTDRYAPSSFAGGSIGGGRTGVLHHGLSASDGATSRPGGFSGAFYNTQGRKFDLPAGTTSMSIELYIDATWADSNRRMAGLWGTAFNSSDAISFYPILEFASDDNNPRFQAWTGSDWLDMGLPTGFAYDQWYTLGIELVNDDVVYTVGDLVFSVPSNSSEYIGNVILQGYNTEVGVTYDIYWDNLASPSLAGVEIPEPASLALWSLMGVAGLAYRGWSRRRQERGAMAA
jgi:hypothetical protein